MINNCIFSTHATLNEVFAERCLKSLLVDQKERCVTWDNFLIYNSHPEEVSNDFIKNIINNLGTDQIKNLEIIPYKESSFKTLNQDVTNQFKFLNSNEKYMGNGKTLFLRSDYILSENFNKIYNEFKQSESIWSLPIYNAKSKTSFEEICELRKLNKFECAPPGVYYRGGTNLPNTPDKEIQPSNILTKEELFGLAIRDPVVKNKLAKIRFPETREMIKFISHNITNDYNLHVFSNDIIKKCLTICLEYLKIDAGWNEANGGINNLFEIAYNLKNIKCYPDTRAFGIHMYHDIESKNYNFKRGDPRKNFPGEEY